LFLEVLQEATNDRKSSVVEESLKDTGGEKTNNAIALSVPLEDSFLRGGDVSYSLLLRLDLVCTKPGIATLLGTNLVNLKIGRLA
jgi:hypothetical protein